MNNSEKPPAPTGPQVGRKVVIIGDGALGAAVAAAATERGLSPSFIGRRGPVAVRVKLEDPTQPPATWDKEWPAAPENLADVEAAFLTVKAFDLENALHTVARFKSGTVIVPLCNGAVEGLVQNAAAKSPGLAWRLGYATVGVSVLGKGHYALRGAGEFAFGPQSLSTNATKVAVERDLTREPSRFKWHASILWLHRRKWLYNTVANSLAAAKCLPNNGLLLGDLPTLAAVFAESLALGRELWGEWPVSRDDLYKGLLSLLEATSANENSMARDVRLGRRTESEWLAGLVNRSKNPSQYPKLVEFAR